MPLTNYYQQGKFLKQFKKRWKNLSETSYREMYNSEALEHVDLIFRSAHTIKGMAATMGYDQTKELCKNIENVFDKIRKKQLKLNSNLASVLFKCIDAIQQMINDENKKIDLSSYLLMLEHPEESHPIENTESMPTTQLPTIRVKMSDLDSLVNLV